MVQSVISLKRVQGVLGSMKFMKNTLLIGAMIVQIATLSPDRKGDCDRLNLRFTWVRFGKICKRF